MQAIAPNALDHWHEHLAPAIRRLRQPDFLATLVDAIHQLVPIESSMISLECRGHASTLLYEHGITERFREAIICRYLSRGYPLDPFCLAVEEDLPEGFYTLGEIVPDDFFQSTYYQTYYLGIGAVEDVYYILDFGPTEKLSICLYNDPSANRYSDAQVAALAGLALSVLELAQQFYAGRTDLSPNPQADLAPRLQEVLRGFGRGVLTDREYETCRLLLGGHSAKSSARLVDTFPETVRMHQKDLYTKLEVSSQSELFALFIECLNQGQRVDPRDSG